MADAHEVFNKAIQSLTRILSWQSSARSASTPAPIRPREQAPLFDGPAQDDLGAYLLAGLRDYTDPPAINDLLMLAPPKVANTIRCDLTIPTEQQARQIYSLEKSSLEERSLEKSNNCVSLVKIFDEKLAARDKKVAAGEKPEDVIWRTLNGPRYIIEKKLGEGGMGGAYLAFKVSALHDLPDEVKDAVRTAQLQPDNADIDDLFAANKGWDLYDLHEKLKAHGRIDDSAYRTRLDEAVQRGLTNLHNKRGVLKVESANAAESLNIQREIEALQSVNKSVFLAQVYGPERDRDTNLLAMFMEFIDGQSLRSKLQTHINAGALPAYELTALNGNHVAQGIIALHSAGRAWGDCKPDNVMCGPTCQIIDFGLSGKGEDVTKGGTPTHLPPEYDYLCQVADAIPTYHKLKETIWPAYRLALSNYRQTCDLRKLAETTSYPDPKTKQLVIARITDMINAEVRTLEERASEARRSIKRVTHFSADNAEGTRSLARLGKKTLPDHYGELRERADAYAWSVMLYELLTGQNPTPAYRGMSSASIVMQRRMHDKTFQRQLGYTTYNRLLKPHEVNPAVPEKLSEEIYGGLNPDWRNRPPIAQLENNLKSNHLFDGAVRISGFSMLGVQAYRDHVERVLNDDTKLALDARKDAVMQNLEPLILARHRNDVYATAKQQWIEPDDDGGNGWSRVPLPKVYTPFEQNPAAKARVVKRIKKRNPALLATCPDGLDYSVGAGICRIREDVGPRIGQFLLDGLKQRCASKDATDAERKHYDNLVAVSNEGPYGVFDHCVHNLTQQLRDIRQAAQDDIADAARDYERLGSVEEVLRLVYRGESCDLSASDNAKMNLDTLLEERRVRVNDCASKWAELIDDRKSRYSRSIDYDAHRGVQTVNTALQQVGVGTGKDGESYEDIVKEAYSFVRQWRKATSEYMVHLKSVSKDLTPKALQGITEGAMLRVYLHNLDMAPSVQLEEQ